MQVLLDQARHQDLAGKALVHAEGAVGQGLLHFLERADGQDTVARHGHRSGRWIGWFHGEDLPGREDPGGSVGRRGREEDIQVALRQGGAGTNAQE